MHFYSILVVYIFLVIFPFHGGYQSVSTKLFRVFFYNLLIPRKSVVISLIYDFNKLNLNNKLSFLVQSRYCFVKSVDLSDNFWLHYFYLFSLLYYIYFHSYFFFFSSCFGFYLLSFSNFLIKKIRT